MHRHLALLALIGLLMSCSTSPPFDSMLQLAGTWKYRQGADLEGEELVFSLSKGSWPNISWRGVMTGLERSGDHGLFHYITEVENLVVEPNGAVRFEIGYRTFHSQRPTIAELGIEGRSGFSKSRMWLSGYLRHDRLEFRCTDDDQWSCPDKEMVFTRETKDSKSGA